MFSDKLKSLRKVRKLTQSQLAKYIGVSPSAIGMYEQGRRVPDINLILKLCNFFNVTVDYLVSPIEQNLISEQVDFQTVVNEFKNLLLSSNDIRFKNNKLSKNDIEKIISSVLDNTNDILKKNNKK